jgi:hypothetical protein
MPLPRRAALCALLLAVRGAARRRLEPPAGRVMHAAGQEPGAFESYSRYMGARAPMAKMLYLGLASLNATAPGTLAPFFADVEAALAADEAPDGAFLALQLGLELPLDGAEALVAEGAYDAAIEALRFALVAVARPVFLRVGYEFNGPWNGYKPESYIGAFRRVAAALRADAVLNETVALVWDGSCDTSVDPTPFFPGDDVVDWQGINIFPSKSAPQEGGAAQSCVWYWLTDAPAAGFPLLIGESTPRGHFTSDNATLAEWHAPFLALVAAHRPALVSYIDEDWEAVPRWKGWGDSRIETAAPALQAAWGAALAEPYWAHRAGKAAVLALLGLPPAVFDR